jgi:hypothetical protein
MHLSTQSAGPVDPFPDEAATATGVGAATATANTAPQLEELGEMQSRLAKVGRCWLTPGSPCLVSAIAANI